jgi:hypothetical protein
VSYLTDLELIHEALHTSQKSETKFVAQAAFDRLKLLVQQSALTQMTPGRAAYDAWYKGGGRAPWESIPQAERERWERTAQAAVDAHAKGSP